MKSYRCGYTKVTTGIKTFDDDYVNIHILFLSKDFNFDVEVAKEFCNDYQDVRVCKF